MRTLSYLLLAVLLVGCTQQEPVQTVKPQSPVSPIHQLADSADYGFEAPVQLTADGDPIQVERPGYACPTMADVDGDGSIDLVVGQFNQGKMHFFRNIAGVGMPPEFAAGEWIMSGEEPATVPGVW